MQIRRFSETPILLWNLSREMVSGESLYIKKCLDLFQVCQQKHHVRNSRASVATRQKRIVSLKCVSIITGLAMGFMLRSYAARRPQASTETLISLYVLLRVLRSPSIGADAIQNL
ncbi:hypothetical protein YC2023_031528 [Brassica napus]